jgi:hypothetical protein
MQQPPNPNPPNRQFLLPPPQWQQQPNYTQPQTYNPPQQPPIPPKKHVSRTNKILFSVIGAVVNIFILAIIIDIASCSAAPPAHPVPNLNATATANVDNLTATANNAAVNAGLTAATSNLTQNALAPTPVPPTPTPTQSPAEVEKAYKASARDTTVADLDKKGASGNGNIVHFTATIRGFVKDSNGNTAAANVSTDTSSSVIQVVFPDNTDVTKLNENDTLEVWGIDAGVFSGTNAYGGTVQEVGIQAQYLTDQTTG